MKKLTITVKHESEIAKEALSRFQYAMFMIRSRGVFYATRGNLKKAYLFAKTTGVNCTYTEKKNQAIVEMIESEKHINVEVHKLERWLDTDARDFCAQHDKQGYIRKYGYKILRKLGHKIEDVTKGKIQEMLILSGVTINWKVEE